MSKHAYLQLTFVLSCAALMLFIFVQPVHPARADAGPELEGTNEVGSSVSPYKFKHTHVQMVDEQVRLKQEIVVEGENTLSRIIVRADFHMRNTSAQAESMEAVFPLTDLRCNAQAGPAMGTLREHEVSEETFTVSIDGQAQTASTLTTKTLIPLDQFDPFQGKVKRLPAPEALTESTITTGDPVVFDASGRIYYPCETQWKKFAITFPPQRDVRIKVNYVMKPKQGYNLYPWDTFTYILVTGRPWYGPIDQVAVSLQLPYPVTREMWAQLPAGYRISADTIGWQWKDVEPNANLEFAILSPQGWKDLQSHQQQVFAHPTDAEAWAALADNYYWLARPPQYPAQYCDSASMNAVCFAQVSDWRYVRLAMDVYNQAIRLQPKENKWHAALGRLLVSMSLSANDGFIHLGYRSMQLALPELKRDTSQETAPTDWLTFFKNMDGKQMYLR